MPLTFFRGSASVSTYRSSGLLKFSGRSSRAFTTLKIAVFAPMPKAKVRMGITARPGFLAKMRAAYPRSDRKEGVIPPYKTDAAKPFIGERGQRPGASTRNSRETLGGRSMLRPFLWEALLQLRVFGSGLLEDGNIRVGVFPQRKKSLVRRPGFRYVARHCVRPRQTHMCQRPIRLVGHNPAMGEHSLKLGGRVARPMRCQISPGPNVHRIDAQKTERGLNGLSQFVRSGCFKFFDGLLGIAAVQRNLGAKRGQIVKLHDRILAVFLIQFVRHSLASRRFSGERERQRACISCV